jgi:C-terminal processing protease CtpA/Prc
MGAGVLALLSLVAAIADVPARPSTIGAVVTLDRIPGAEFATSMTVRALEPGSAAQRARLAPGDRITAVAGKTIRFKDDVDLVLMMARLKAGTPTKLSVTRGAKQISVTVSPVAMTDEQIERFKSTIAFLERASSRRR